MGRVMNRATEDISLADVVDAAQAAAMLGVTRQHVVHLCNTRRLPARRLTSTWVTTRQAVETYARTRRGPGRPRSRPEQKDDDCNIIASERDRGAEQQLVPSDGTASRREIG